MEPDDMKSDIPLPDELLSEIISHFIPLSQWSRCLERVSRQFQRCVLAAYRRIKSMNCRKLFSLKKIEHSGEVFQYNNILEKLLTVCPNLADIVGFDLAAKVRRRVSFSWDILGQFDRLEAISLTSLAMVEFRPFADFAANSKSLKILKVICCDFDSGGILNVGSLSVVDFRLWVFDKPTISLENLSEKLTALTVFCLEKAFKADHSAMKHCKNLERFSFYLFTLNDYEIFLNNLPSLCKLTSLQINGSPRRITPNLLNEKFCGHLNFLKTQLRCMELRDIIVHKEVHNFLFTECLQLQTLVLSGRSALSASTIKKFRRLPANLKMLTLRDNQAEALTILLPNLVELMNLTDLSITDPCNDWKKWENMCCLRNLQNLHLCVSSVTDSLLQAWDRKRPEMLEKLVTFKLPCCPHISDIGGILIASKARNLKQLDLYNSRISDKTIFVLADCAKNLAETNLAQKLPLLFDENDVISLIIKATRLKKVKVNYRLTKKVIANENFLPLAENVEIVAVFDLDF